VTEFAGQGTDIVHTTFDLDLASLAFKNIENGSLEGLGNTDLNGNDGANRLFGNVGENIINGRGGNDTIAAGAGTDLVSGDAGNDVIDGGDDGDDLTGGDGNDTVDGGLGSDVMSGGAGNDVMRGGDGGDLIDAGDGNDRLEGGSGINSLIGGKGNDVYILEGTDTVSEQAGQGIDEIRSEIILNLSLAALANVENATLLGIDSLDATGNGLGNVLTGNAGNNELSGAAGNDTIVGGLGNDTLDGGGDDDKMAGGKGDDTYFVDSGKDVVTENAKEGFDIVNSTISYTLGANVEQLILLGAGNLSGTGNALDNTLVGNSGANQLDGGNGNDTLIGNGANDTLLGGAGDDAMAQSGGDDVMKGGTGNDQYAVVDAGDKVFESAGQGIDSIFTTLASFDLSVDGDNVENVKYIDMGSAVLTGNALNNQITGNAGADVLTGNAGNDTLDGGDGKDTMKGGLGNDVYIVSSADDEVTENANQGIDEIRSVVGLLLGANIENFTLLSGAGATVDGNGLANVLKGGAGEDDLRGNDNNDTLIGAGGSDHLDGGTGKDSMAGGAGDDTYTVDNIGDKVVENAGEGVDEVITTLTSYTLGANLDDLTFLTGGNNVGNGNALDNGIEGRAGNDRFDGKAGDDTLHGLAGNDTLFGGDGDDTLVGFDDNDLLDGGNGDDLLSGLGGNDTLKGGAGNDELFGEAGDDLLIGGAGDDSYYVEDSGDTIQEAANGGIDTIRANVSLALAANVENAKLEVGSLEVLGNGLNNVIEGSIGNDEISGAAGNDTLFGRAGADTLDGSVGDDVIEGGAGLDELTGGAGNDVFLYRLDAPVDLASLGEDTIFGFEVGKDKIDLYDLFQEFDIFSADPIDEGYLRLQDAGANVILQFDSDGGGDSFVNIASLVGPPSITLADIVYQQAGLPS
jgi:Ca2+-binding RTX toxin-like protein